MLIRLLVLSTLLKQLWQFALGVDYGGEFHKSSMILPGKYFYMVENQISKKKNPTAMAFCGGDRVFENQAMKKFLKKTCDSFTYPTRFLYKRLAEGEDFNAELYLDNQKVSKDDIGFLFEVKKGNLPQLFNFTRNSTDDEGYLIRGEEINAMIIENNLANAGSTGNTVFREGVVTIPSNDLSIEARKRIKATNELAGFKLLGLVHENTAAALYFALDREPIGENILIANVGASGTKLSLINFRNDTIKSKTNTTETLPSVVVIEDIYTDKVSGHALDVCMSNYVLDKHLDSKPNKEGLREQVDLFKRRRLATDVQRPKEVLSVNRESHLTMEDFFGYMPLTAQVVKSEFEERCKYLADDLEQLFKDFEAKLARHNMSKSDINVIEIIGGSTRVPFIQDKLKEFYGLKLNTRINGDDGPALGATFLAGNYTVGVRTKRILMSDGPNYPVHISVRFDNQTETYKEAELFHRKTRYGTKKTLSIQSLDVDTHIRMFTNDTESYYKDYLIKDVRSILDGYKDKNVTEWKAVFSFEMDNLGIPGLKNAELLIKENVTETVNITVPRNNTNATNSTEKEVRQEVRNYNRTNKERLGVEIVGESYKSLFDSKEEFNVSKQLLKDLKEHEEHKKALSSLRNTLESYIYKLKSMADAEEHNVYLSEEERASYRTKSDEIDEFFMSEELSKATLEDLKSRAKDVETFMHPFEYRREEHRNRNGVYSRAIEALDKAVENVDTIQRLRNWVPVEKIDEAKERIRLAKEEIVKAYEEQLATPLHLNPKFNYEFVSERADELQRMIGKLRSIEKPKKPANTTEELEDLLKNMGSFNMTDPNMGQEKIKDLLEKMKKHNITMDELFNKTETADENADAGNEGRVSEETGIPEATDGAEDQPSETIEEEAPEATEDAEGNPQEEEPQVPAEETETSDDDKKMNEDAGGSPSEENEIPQDL